MNIWDWLPAFPWEGPPLPRFLQVFWPWISEANKAGMLSLLPPPFLKLPKVCTSGPTSPEVLYQNAEELEVVRDANGSISKVIRHIKVTKQNGG